MALNVIQITSSKESDTTFVHLCETAKPKTISLEPSEILDIIKSQNNTNIHVESSGIDIQWFIKFLKEQGYKVSYYCWVE
jgi:hypothetical protein